jgi:hypothetical protein
MGGVIAHTQKTGDSRSTVSVVDSDVVQAVMRAASTPVVVCALINRLFPDCAGVVGPTGAVTSVDIDPDVIGWARRGLTAAGYPHVTAVVGDGEHGHSPDAPYDAIIVHRRVG